jgi:predicted PurR-regulated permease PerM
MSRALTSGLPRSDIVLIGVTGAVVMFAGLWAAAGIVATTMLALVLTIAVLPVFGWARRHGWPTWLATLFALVSAYAILATLLVIGFVCAVRFVNVIPEYEDDAADAADQLTSWLSDLGVSSSATDNALQKLDPSKVVGLVTEILSDVLGFAGNVFFLVTVMFFLVVAVPGFGPRIAALRKLKPGLTSSLGLFVSRTQRYLVMTAVFGAIVAVLDAGALWLLGIPLALTWGFFSFITNFIPNIGFVIGVIPPALLGLLDSGWQGMLLVILVYSLINVTIQTFIQPRFVGATVGLSAEVTFLSLVLWTFLLGALGALLAVPMTLLLRALFIDADPRAAWVAPLIDTSVEDDPSVEDDSSPPSTESPPVAPAPG